MVDNFCSKCGSYGGLRLEDRGTHVALMCDNCNSWIKWVGKKEISMYENLLKNKSSNKDDLLKLERNLKNSIEKLGLSKEQVIEIVNKIYKN